MSNSLPSGSASVAHWNPPSSTSRKMGRAQREDPLDLGAEIGGEKVNVHAGS